MTLMEAAAKWQMSPNWVRELIKSKRVKAKLRTDSPVPYYEIPDGTPRPPSMQRSPMRAGSPKKVQPASIARREYRAKQIEQGIVTPAKAKAKKKPKSKSKSKS